MSFGFNVNPCEVPYYSRSSGGEREYYGNETVSQINNRGNATLNGTTVRGEVTTKGKFVATNASIGGSVRANSEAKLISSWCDGKIKAKGSIEAKESNALSLDAHGSIEAVECNISEKISARATVSAFRCPNLGQVEASEAVLHDCPNIQSVSVNANLTLDGSTVLGDVLIDSPIKLGSCMITNSNIHGTLSCSLISRLTIAGGEIDTIIIGNEVQQDDSSSDDSDQGTYNVTTTGKYSHAIGHIGKRSHGGGVYNVSAIGKRSVAIGTLSGGIGVQHNHCDQAQFYGGSGPGDSMTVLEPPKKYPQKAVAPSTKTLVLRNCNVKKIIFEGKKGIVKLEGSSLAPKLTGGEIQKQSAAAQPIGKEPTEIKV